jgi:tetratricopeptide (TPR) repeat protein
MFLVVAGIWGWLTVQAGDAIPGWNRDYSLAEGATLRVLWSVIWQFSICAAARSWMPARPATREKAIGLGTWFAADGLIAVVLTVVAAWVVPYVYVLDSVDRATARATQELSRQRYGLAWEELRCLADMASERPVGSETPIAVLQSLRSFRAQLVTAVQQPLAADAPIEQQLQRARQLAQLRLWDDVRAILEPLADGSPEAAWQLISMYDERGELQQSVDLASRTWEQLVASPSEPNKLSLQANILVVWAHNLRRLNRFEEARQVLQNALGVWPRDNGLVHFELGYHYKESGFYHQARDEFRAAAAADASFANKVSSEMQDLQSQIPFCLPRPRSGIHEATQQELQQL